MTTAIKTTDVAHWDYLATRFEAIKALNEITTKFQAAIDTAINGTPEEKLAVLNSLQSYANKIKHLEDKIYKFNIGQKVFRMSDSRTVGFNGTIVARMLNTNSPIPVYTVEYDGSGRVFGCHEFELVGR